jgi:hypothetical protein
MAAPRSVLLVRAMAGRLPASVIGVSIMTRVLVVRHPRMAVHGGRLKIIGHRASGVTAG